MSHFRPGASLFHVKMFYQKIRSVPFSKTLDSVFQQSVENVYDPKSVSR